MVSVGKRAAGAAAVSVATMTALVGWGLWARPAAPGLSQSDTARPLMPPDRKQVGRVFVAPRPLPTETARLAPKRPEIFGPFAPPAAPPPPLTAARLEAALDAVPYTAETRPAPGGPDADPGPTPAQSMSAAWLLRPELGPPPPPDTPAVRVRLSAPVYRIRIDPKTGEPQMPTGVRAFAEAAAWPAGAEKPSSFEWNVSLRWEYAPFPTAHRIEREAFTGSGPLDIPLGGQVRGGVLTVTARAKCDGEEIVGRAKALVLADNPTRALILKAFPRSRFGLIASKIATAESGLRQFTEPKEGDPGGLPLLSYTYDAGIMQLNGPSGAISSAEDIWDWRANVLRGLGMLGAKRRTTLLASRRRVNRDAPAPPGEPPYTLLYLNLTRALVGKDPVPSPPAPPLSAAPGSGLLPGEADPDGLALSQIERDTVRRYNGGSEYRFDVTADPDTLEIASSGWFVDPTRGGIHPKSGALDYIARVLNARSGFALPPPPTPKRARR